MGSQVDVMVLGAGIVGVSAALHLQARGRSVVLVDKHASAGRETSYGNAGLIERSSIVPYFFPRDVKQLLGYAFNRSPEAHYHVKSLLKVAPFLIRYALASSPAGQAASTAAILPLIERCLIEHEALIDAAGASHLLRKVGWIKAFRHAASRDEGLLEAESLRPYGLRVDPLDAAQLAAKEPHLNESLIGGLHFHDTATIADPGALSLAYAALLTQRGGRLIQGDAMTLQDSSPGWRIDTAEGSLQAREAVVALGPWADSLLRRLGYRLPFGVKRGYHRHYRPIGNAVLNHPLLDSDKGYLLAPMHQGIRLTTGAEFALRDAAKTPIQLSRVEPVARRLFPLGQAVEAEPWMGARPCLPDMLPVIGKAPRHAGLWFDFGHQHHGLTLGPVSGRLLAEMITGEPPLTDPKPYRLERFGSH